MAGKKRQELTCTFYMIDRETGDTQQIDRVPPEALAKMQERLSENMSAYYTQHMDEYTRLEGVGFTERGRAANG